MIFRLEYKNRNGLQARLDITTPGSSVVKEIEGTENPFILSYKGDKSDKSSHFMTSSAEINIYETPEFNIDTLKTSNETQIKVDHFIDDQLNWTGFVIPDFFSREIGGAGVVSMTASDRISTLKGVTLSDLPAMVQIRDLAVRCLARTGLDLPLKTMADFSADDFLGFNHYFRSEIASQRLYDSKGRSISCYDILKSILVTSGSTLRQRGGEWHIINKLQHEAGVGRVYSTENTSVDYVESVHHFDEIVKGARRTIIPVAGSVGIYHEYGGGKLHPDNYDFSQGLTGWTPVGGFVAGIGNQSVNGYKIESGVYVPDYGEPGLNHLKNANPYQRNVNPIYLESAPIPVPYSGSGAVNIEFDINGIGPMLTTQAVMRIAIVAQKGEELLTLHHGGAFAPMPSANPPVFEKRFKMGFTSSDFTAGADTQSMRVSGTLESSELEGWELKIRIYGGGSSNTILINAASIHMKSSQETPKGAIYKRDQGSDFTKTHDIETAIFGDYLTTGKDGYFYDYPIDDTSSIHNPYSGISSLWTTPYFPTETDALPILQHVVRQQARMFSVAHDLISGEIEIERFDPLSIFVDCNGKRHVIVSASFDFLRSSVRVELEEIAYANLTVRDYIYSYFGEGESGIKSVGGIASGTGGGGTGGGLTPEQLEILSWWKKDPDNPNTIYTEMNAYSKLELSAYGLGTGGGGGGGGSDYERLDTWASYDSSKAGWVLSAFLGNDLNTRVTAIDGRVTAIDGRVTAIDGRVTAIDDRVTDLENSSGGGGGEFWKLDENGNLYTEYNAYSTGELSAYGAGAGGGGGGSDYERLDTWASYDSSKSGWVLSAFLGNDLNTRVTAIDSRVTDLENSSHTHSNKAQLDLITQSNIDVLAKLSIVNGNLQIDGNAYATGELSAYGAGDGGGGGGGIIETVYGYGNLGQTFNNNVLTDTFNAYTINQINTRLVSVESGSATTVNTTGTGNAITSITKSGTVITANKDLTFSLAGHSHTISDITNLQTTLNNKLETSIFNTHNTDNVRHITGAERTKWDGVVTDFGNLEIGGRNYLPSFHSPEWNIYSGAVVDKYSLHFPSNSGNPKAEIILDVESDTNYTFTFNSDYARYYIREYVGGVGDIIVTGSEPEVTFNTGSSTKIILTIDTGSTNRDKDRNVSNIKLEKGNKPTDWTPSPEDQVSDWNTTDVNSFSFIKNKPTTLAGYGITDAYTKTEVNSALISKLDKSVFDDLFEKVEVSTGVFAIKAKYNFYGVGEVSAYGIGSGGGSGGGIIETVYGYGNLGQTFNNNILTDTFNAYTINQINTRLSAVESGAALSIVQSGTGNAVTSVTKSGTALTVTKGLNFSQVGHTHLWADITNKPSTFTPSAHSHTISDITGLQTALNSKLEASIFNTHNNDNIRHITGAERTKWDGVVTDFGNLEIGGRNLLLNTWENPIQASLSSYIILIGATTKIDGNTYYTASIKIDSTDSTAQIRVKQDLHSGGRVDTYSEIIENSGVLSIILKTHLDVSVLSLYLHKSSAESIVFISKAKLEKGNKATDWTPAPEDQVSDWLTTDVNSFSFIKNKPTLLSQFTDNIGVATHIANKANPHSVTKSQVGLGNVDNTSDSAKNVLSATKLQTPRTIWGQSFDGTGNIIGALSGATTIIASTSVTVPKVIFAAAGWSMEQVGNELQMKHNNVLKMRFTSAGSIVATEEITAFG